MRRGSGQAREGRPGHSQSRYEWVGREMVFKGPGRWPHVQEPGPGSRRRRSSSGSAQDQLPPRLAGCWGGCEGSPALGTSSGSRGVPSATGCRTACKRTAVPLSFVSPRQDTDIPALTSREEWDRGQCKAGRCHLKCPLAAPGHTDPCPTARDTRQGVHKPRPGMSLAPRHLVQRPWGRCVLVPVSPRPSGACASAHPRSDRKSVV